MKALVGFSKPRSRRAWLGRCIQVVLGTPFDHTYLVRVIDGEAIVFEARGLDIHAQSLDMWSQTEQQVAAFSVELTPAAWSYLLSQLGRQYSHLEFLGLGIQRLLHMKRNPLSDHGNVCSTLVAHCLGLPDPDSCDPRDVWAAVQPVLNSNPNVKGS